MRHFLWLLAALSLVAALAWRPAANWDVPPLGTDRAQVEAQLGRPRPGRVICLEDGTHTTFVSREEAGGTLWSWSFGTHPEAGPFPAFPPGDILAYGPASQHFLPYVRYDERQKVVWTADRVDREGLLPSPSQWRTMFKQRTLSQFNGRLGLGQARPHFCKGGPIAYRFPGELEVMFGNEPATDADSFAGPAVTLLCRGEPRATWWKEPPAVRPKTANGFPKIELPDIGFHVRPSSVNNRARW